MDNEQVLEPGPQAFIVVPPVSLVQAFIRTSVDRFCFLKKIAQQSFALIEDPVVVDERGMAKIDKNGQAVLRFGASEVRLSDEVGFPLCKDEYLRQQSISF